MSDRPEPDDPPASASGRHTKLTWRIPVRPATGPHGGDGGEPPSRPSRPTVMTLRLRLRAKLVVAMLFAALVPVLLVASVSVGVILSSLEAGVRDDANRQLTVGLNLVLRTFERLGEQAVELAETTDLPAAVAAGQTGLEAWFAHEAGHLASAELQLLDPNGNPIFSRVVGGATQRFADLAITARAPGFVAGQQWSRGVTLIAVGDRVIVRATAPVVDPGLTLRGVLVLSVPLDGDFADSIKGALSADVLLGGPSGTLAVTFRTELGSRQPPVMLSPRDRDAAFHGRRVIRNRDVPAGRYAVAATALLDQDDRPVGLIGVAVDREPLAATKRLAIRSLVGAGAGTLVFALVLALVWSRQLSAPIARLHRGAIAVSRGDLDHRIEVPGSDELADLATAFNQMTETLQDNQGRLAARMREIVALHDAGRAVSAVIDLDQVSRKIVDVVARTFDVQIAALWVVDSAGKLRASAARARRADVSSALATDEAKAAADALRPIAEQIRSTRVPLRLDRAGADPVHGAAALAAGTVGPLVALPLDRNTRVVGVLAVARANLTRSFSDADLNLLTTFADQAGAAIENALLYQEVRGASEELDRKVRVRTLELTATNSELGRTLDDLRETQAQLVLSERMAGLGLLVAGVAHEINSPTSAIRGSIDGLASGLTRVALRNAELVSRVSNAASIRALTDFLEPTAIALAERPLPTGLTARKAARELAAVLERVGAADCAQELADLGATPEDAERLLVVLGDDHAIAGRAVAALTEHVYVHRTASTVRHAVSQIQRIVGALKSYSHLDQQATRSDADLHDGLETTLALLHHALRDIVVERRYGVLPKVPVFVDELNQVWTNLISNAVQALAGKGTLAIETEIDRGGTAAVVRVIDDGPGVPVDVLPQIFEPFFTTKPKGEGTGLGLGIARQIVAKHGGEIVCTSRPGRTCFEVHLPLVIAPAAPRTATPGWHGMTRREVIVCVDDEEGVLRVLRQQLGARFGHECQIATARSGDEAVALFDELTREGESIAVVIADQIMPGMKGVELLEIVDRRLPETTKILLTGQAGLDAVVDAINRAHLHLYIGKPWHETALLLAVEGLLRQYRLAHENQRLVASLSAKNLALLEMNRELEAKIHERTHELAEANSRLAQLAVTDGLTGLYNHRHFHERIALEVERSQRNGLSLSLLMMDVDNFKQFNDSYGHPAGDEVLRQLARVLGDARRANDVVARYGGEEFAVILVDTPKFTAAKVAERVRERVYAHDFADATPRAPKLSVSIGVATFPDDGSDAETLVRVSDAALYAAKRSGRNRVVLATEVVAATVP